MDYKTDKRTTAKAFFWLFWELSGAFALWHKRA